MPTLVGELARALDLASRSTYGLIQYALGSGYDYVPLAQVLDWTRNGDDAQRSTRAFGGRVVLFGAVLPYEDRFAQPVPLARWDPVATRPACSCTRRRCDRSRRARSCVPPAFRVQRLLIAAAVALWFLPTWHRRVLALLVFAMLAFVASLWRCAPGSTSPLGTSLRVALAAVALKSALEAWQVRQERTRLRAQFGGYVSPAVLDAILDGRLDDDARRGRRMLAFLFVDIRGFVELTVCTTDRRRARPAEPLLRRDDAGAARARRDDRQLPRRRPHGDFRRAESARQSRGARRSAATRHARAAAGS